MEQLTQNLKDGKMELLEVPFPAVEKGQVLIRNHHSLISTGTEGKTVKDARLGYIGKARARKEEVKKVVVAAKTFGVRNTYRMVMNKLDAPSPLGYSCAGEVIAIANDVKNFRVGDLVACGGVSAVHAEVVSVPVNLCVLIPEKVSTKEASFTTVGAIALQGIRQADLKLGENCAVIGLGLVGQLTVQMLRASGVKVIGIDLDDNMINIASANGCDLVLNRNHTTLEEEISEFTKGFGTDSVIITAGSTSTDPVDLAGAISRKKGNVVIVGGVPTGFKRPNYFKKELDLRMSSSYGPGRYDSNYEAHGIDYPYGYVRWTENRNMQAFVDLINEDKINISKLLTHTFKFNDAPQAYDLLLNRHEPYVGMVLEYDLNKKLKKSVKLVDNKPSGEKPAVGLIGAGSFGQNFLLPAMKNKADLIAVATSRPNNAVNIARKFEFNHATSNAEEVISNSDLNTIFIATRHDSHAKYVINSLQQNKNVFVEKPLCLYPEELDQIIEAYTKSGSKLMVGYNRRFSPFVQQIMASISKELPKSINYRINAGFIPSDHWIHDPKVGGGRIIGEVCHFIDLAMFISGHPIVSVSARALRDSGNKEETLVVNLDFEDGSIASISYFSNGNKSLNKENIEIFCGGEVFLIDDFKSLTSYSSKTEKTSGNQDKGHNNEVSEYLNAVAKGTDSPISFNDLILTSHATFCVIESLRNNGERIPVNIGNLENKSTED